MIMLNVLEGELLFTKSAIEGDIAKKNYTLDGEVINNAMKSIPTYRGAYEVTPSDTQQILSTENMRMEHNVVINPIPSNYGLITWNGSFLTVS